MITVLLFGLCLMSLTLLPICASSPESAAPLENPVFVKTQYAGNLGLASVGIGKSFTKQKLVCDLNYGYLPKHINGVRVHTFGFKSSYHIKGRSIGKVERGFYLGTSLTYSITPNTYVNYPNYFPKDYYPPNAIHLNPFVGTNISIPSKNKKFSKTALFAELGTVDYEISYALKNKSISLIDICNLSFGIAFQLR